MQWHFLFFFFLPLFSICKNEQGECITKITTDRKYRSYTKVMSLSINNKSNEFADITIPLATKSEVHTRDRDN